MECKMKAPSCSMSLQLHMRRMQSSAASQLRPFPVKSPRPSDFPASNSRRCTTAMASMVGNATPAPPIPKLVLPKSNDLSASQSLLSSSIAPARPLVFRPTPELGLVSIFFVLSMALGAVVSVCVISIPTMSAFRRLENSADKLSKVVMEEVPGTLSSLKLSVMEINELTEQLSNPRS